MKSIFQKFKKMNPSSVFFSSRARLLQKSLVEKTLNKELQFDRFGEFVKTSRFSSGVLRCVQVHSVHQRSVISSAVTVNMNIPPSACLTNVFCCFLFSPSLLPLFLSCSFFLFPRTSALSFPSYFLSFHLSFFPLFQLNYLHSSLTFHHSFPLFSPPFILPLSSFLSPPSFPLAHVFPSPPSSLLSFPNDRLTGRQTGALRPIRSLCCDHMPVEDSPRPAALLMQGKP